MRPDDPRLRVVAEQQQQRFLVAMRVQPQIPFDREIDDALDLLARRRLAVDVELADAAIDSRACIPDWISSQIAGSSNQVWMSLRCR